MTKSVQKSYRRLTASAGLLLAGILHAQAPAARPEFEVASVKPNTSENRLVMIRPPVGGRFTATNANLKMLIGLAYNVKDFEISGGPSWIDSGGYDVVARAADSNIGIEQLRPMLQSLLEDRFKLMVHRETKQVPVYALLPAKGGLKLPASKEGGCVVFKPDAPPPPPQPGERPPVACGGFLRAPNFLQAGKVGMAQLTNVLAGILGRPVVDKTGFTGTFDVHLEFSPEGTTFGAAGFGPPPGAANDAANPDTSRPSIFTALQEQLGLKLESQKGPGEILVVDHVEKLTEN